MVFLILTRPGFDDVRSQIDATRDAVWVNADVLSPVEVADLRAAGLDLTTFSNPLDLADLASDIGTIREHQPGRVVWVEAIPE
jgi:hypothetical protein